MSTATCRAIVALLALPVCALAADPVTFSWSSSNSALVTTPDSIQQSAACIVVTARGYVVEFDDANPLQSVIIGPFSTSTVGNHQIFGPRTASLRDNNSRGLGLFVAPTPGVAPTGVDYGGQAYAAVFDSGSCCFSHTYLGDNPDIPGPPKLKKTDFALLSFSTPVDVSQFTTDTANRWWAAGWTSAPDLSAGLAGALASATIIQSRGTQNDPFTHNLSGFDDISVLAIGYSPQVSGYPELGDYFPGGFYLSTITVAAVPEPGTWSLLVLGLLTTVAWLRKRNGPQ